MLGNVQIRQLVENNQLISGFDESCLRHCSYRLRIGKLIQPGGAILYDSEAPQAIKLNWIQKGAKWLLDRLFPNNIGGTQKGFKVINSCYELRPNELILFQTKEKVHIPMNLSASYYALDSIAKQGLLLINASMVESGYEGYLSGVLLNFSSKSYLIKPDMQIAKICFYQVEGNVENKNLAESVGDQYTEILQNKAQIYTTSFLDVEKIKEDVINQTASRVSRNLKFGGLLLALILAFCTIEPVLYKYIWYDSWTPVNSTYIEAERSLQYQKQMEIIDVLSRKIDSLQIKMDRQNAGKSDPKPKGRL